MNDLPAAYYLKNFQTLVTFVQGHYGDILNAAEHEFADTFSRLGVCAQCLYVRLISRKGPHFRLDKIAYAEIEDLPSAIDQLLELGMFQKDPELAANSIFALLTRPELEALLRESTDVPLPSTSSLRKEGLFALALELVDELGLQRSFYEHYAVLTPQYADIVLVYRLLFFGNLSQDLTEFVLEDLGLLQFETYAISMQDRLFNSRPIITNTLAYQRCRQMAWDATQLGDVQSLVDICENLPHTLGESALERRRARILNDTARLFERAGALELALVYYARAGVGPARERTARILEKQGKVAQAHAFCLQLQQEAVDDDEVEFSRSFGHKLARKLGITKESAKRISHPSEKLILPKVPSQRVEEAVLAHYHSQGMNGFYAENRLWNDLFGLLFWDIIFAPVRGAFFNRYQRGPKGLFSERFRRDRDSLVRTRLDEIKRGEVMGRARQTFESKQGLANHLVNWRYLQWEQVALVLSSVPSQDLAAVFDRFSRHPGEHRSGLPDLFVFSGEKGYTLVEVKGPGDQVQRNQGRWMHFFAEHDIPYRVARVVWEPSP